MSRHSITRTAIATSTALVALFGLSEAAASNSSDGSEQGLSAYPHYDIAAYCQEDYAVRVTGRRYDCEDPEHAVAIFLKDHWATLDVSEADLVAMCAASSRHGVRRPSYLELLQCITRIPHAAD